VEAGCARPPPSDVRVRLRVRVNCL
jgi:hypothetical protein